MTLVQTNAPYDPQWVASIRGVRALVRLVPYLWNLWNGARRAQVFHVMANSGWSWFLFAAPAILIGKARNIRVVVNYRGGDAGAFLERSGRWVRPVLKRADVVAVPSGFLRDVFRRSGVEAQILPNVVDLNRFRPGLRRKGVNDPVCILVSRNLEPIYDIDTAIRAFALVHKRFPNACLVVTGSGPERERLEALTNELGVRNTVTFTGRLDRDQMTECYRRADVALNPSRVDNMPNSILEALASGVPVVTTDVGGVGQIVRNETTALLVPPGEPEPMARALLRILDDAALAGALRSAGLQEVEQYTWSNVRDRLLLLYVPATPLTDGRIETA